MTNPPPAPRLQFADDTFLRRHRGGAPTVNQVLWRLDGPYDADRLRELADGIAAGALHRRVVRRLVPGARHRWAPADTLPVLELQTAAVAKDRIGGWAQAQADVALDPDEGRSWRLSAADVVAVTAGSKDRQAGVIGGIVSLTCTRAVADEAALIDAVVRASTHADPIVLPRPERGARAVLADTADAARQLASVGRWARARARRLASATRTAIRVRLAARIAPADGPGIAAGASTSPAHTAPAHTGFTPRLALPPGGFAPVAGVAPNAARTTVRAPAVIDAGWRAPVLHVEVPADRVAQTAADHGGTPHTWFITFLARLVHATGRLAGEPVPVALPVPIRGSGHRRADSSEVARITVPADVLALRDLGWVRAAAKEAYSTLGQTGPGVPPVPPELVQMLPDAIVRRLPRPPAATVLASDLGASPDGYVQAPGGSVRAVTMLSSSQGASAAELRAAGGGLVAFCTTVGRTTMLSIAAPDPDRVADVDTLRDLVLAEAAVWKLPAVSW